MDRRSERGRGMNSSPPRKIQVSNEQGSPPGRRRQLPSSYRDLPKGGQGQAPWRNGSGNGSSAGFGGGGGGGGTGVGRGAIDGRRRSDGVWVPDGDGGGKGRPGSSPSRGTRDGLGSHHADLRRIDGGGSGRAGYSPGDQEWNNRDSRDLPRTQNRPVLIEPSTASAIGARAWERERSPARNGYRQDKDWHGGGGGGGGNSSGGDGYNGSGFSGDRGPRYGNGGGGNFRDDPRGHRDAYGPEFVHGRSSAHIVAHDSWDQPRGRPPSRERGGGNGHVMRGPPPAAWDPVPVQRDDSRPPRNGAPTPLNGSRGQGRRSDHRSRSRTRDRGGGYVGRDHMDGRDRHNGRPGAGGGDGGRGSYRRSSGDRRPRSLGRSLGRSRRGYGGISPRGLTDYRGGGGGSGGRGSFRQANGGGGHGNEFKYAGFAVHRRDNSRRRNEGRGGWGGGKSGRHGRSSSGVDDPAGSGRRNGDHSGGGDEQGHFKGKKGTLIGGRYEVQEDVGLGTFGRVVECWDLKRRRRVAVKVVRKVKKYHESALIEAQILRDVNQRERSIRRHPEASLCVEMLSQLEHMGHCCLVFECLGQSLYDYLKKNEYRGFPTSILRPIAQELLQAVEFLHSIKLIHTDLKPENVLLRSLDERSMTLESGEVIRVPVSPHIKVIDFGGATYEHDSHASVVNTRQYRAPEVILGMRWLYPSDLWSVGCIIAELFLGDLLFATHNNMEHLALMEKCVGMFPSNMLAKAPRAHEFFDELTGQCKGAEECDAENRRHIRRMKRLQDITAPVQDTEMGTLLEQLLTLDPKRRSTATEALRHRFFGGL